ncbi:ATP-binding protein [Vagococcus fluvialis]|nr:ATP-binding protein [Vagococcus fluvialis]
MTEIKINFIHYKNFKGFKDYKLELNGQSAKAIGPNGSGKTSFT